MKGKRAVVGVFGLLVLGLLSSQGGAVQFQASDIRLDTGDAAGANDSCSSQIAADETGGVYVTWRDKRNGSADIYFNYSRDYGVSWQPVDIRLDTGDAAGANRSYSPQIAADETGGVYVTWRDKRNGNYDIYFNYSRDYGVSWQPVDIRVDTGDAAGVNDSYDSQIAADEAGNVYVTWEDYRNNEDYGDIYFNYSRELPPCEANLDQLRVYPNPFIPNDQDTNTGDWDSGITFDKFTCDGVRVWIYTLTGELVREIIAEEYFSFIQWDGRNEQGDKVASGIYLYLVTNEVGEQKAGKLVVIK